MVITMNRKQIKLWLFFFLFRLKGFTLQFVHDKRGAVKFNIMGMVIMVIAIALGTMVGSMLTGAVGLAGGIIGSFAVGFVIYVIWAFLSGQRIQIMKGVIFAGLVIVANLIAGMVQGATGFGGGILTYVVQAIILMFLWGYFGGTSLTGKARRRGKRHK